MISINITYYNESKWLLWWYRAVRRLEDEGVSVLLNICDDGSQIDPAEKFFEKRSPTSTMRLFRVVEDIGFNSHGARNLLMQQTTTEWNMMSDIDRNYPDDTLTAIVEDEPFLRQGTYYSFCDMKNIENKSLNEYVVHRADFWNTGGYDEEFVNIHWGDRYFLDTLNRVAKQQVMIDWRIQYVRGARNVSWADVPITQYPDDRTLIHPKGKWADSEYRLRLKNQVKQRNKTHEGRMSKKVINFEWEQVF
jgi:hypothetical protein